MPIIITGNDFSKLYAPLVRAGRMSAFEWIPTPEERCAIVCTIFPELTQAECRQLIQELQETLKGELPEYLEVLPVAFYSHLRANLLDEDLWEEIEEHGLNRTVDTIILGKEPDLSMKINYERVFNKGLELARSGKIIGHLKSINNHSRMEP